MTATRLQALRTRIASLGLDGFVVPRADEHLGEYVPLCAERLQWLTGFSGSAGLAAIGAKFAAHPFRAHLVGFKMTQRAEQRAIIDLIRDFGL